MSDLLGTAAREYKVNKGYLWLLGDQMHQPWSTIVWSRAITPRHTFTTWLFFHQRLPLKSRMAKFFPQPGGLSCPLCDRAEETLQHLFFDSSWVTNFWHHLTAWWPLPNTSNFVQFFKALRALKGPKGFKNITYAVAAVAIYQIWNTRNHSIFKGKIIPATVVYHQTREHII